MTRSEGIRVVTEWEAERLLLERGWRKTPCAACEGRGHFTVVNDDAHDWKKYACEACEGATFVWTEPAVISP